MKIGIDARFVGPQGTGLGQYTEKLILNLEKIDQKNEYKIFLTSTNWQYLNLKNSNFNKVLADVPWYSFKEQIKMPGIYREHNLDLLHIPHFNVPILYRNKFIVTIHDLIHHNFSQESATTKNPIVYKLKRTAYKITIKNAVKKASGIIVPSNFVKAEVVSTFKIPQSKITVTYEAAEEEYFQAKSTRDGRYLLYVGNLYPHKNLEVVLNALEDIRDLKLVIVCPRNVFFKRINKSIKEKKLEDKVFIHDFQNTQNLVKLFERATAYIVPSLSEGFGIPGLNAMAAKIPTIASDIPPLREIYQTAALYFDPNNQQDLVNKINELSKNKTLQKKLINQGSQVAKKYSWKNMAEKTLYLYRQFL